MFFGVAISTKSKGRGSEAGKGAEEGKMGREELIDIIQNGQSRRKAVLDEIGIEERGSACMGDTHFVNSCTGETLDPEIQLHMMKAVARRTAEVGARERKAAKDGKA